MPKKVKPVQTIYYDPSSTELYIYIRRKGWLQPTPYVYKKPDLTFVKNYKNEKKY